MSKRDTAKRYKGVILAVNLLPLVVKLATAGARFS